MNRIIVGDCYETLSQVEDGSVHCVVTSPPYYGLRNYGMEGQIGLEETPEEYISNVVILFYEIWRVLRDDGTVWLNLGDSYAGHNVREFRPGNEIKNGGASNKNGVGYVAGAKPKDLLMIPARVALALQVNGWYLRSDIIWHKPNPMPESIRDRPTGAHEHVFLLAKTEHYYYDAEAVKEPMAVASAARYAYSFGGAKSEALKAGDKPTAVVGFREVQAGRNMRNVWTITTKAYKGAHFATMPVELAATCIKAGTSEYGCCGECGAPQRRVVERVGMVIQRSERTHELGRTRSSGTMVSPASSTTTGWQPTCNCTSDVVPCVVLDPFGGAGTTALAAQRLGRDSILCELNPDYVELARVRLLTGLPAALARNNFARIKLMEALDA